MATIPGVVIEDRCDLKKWVVVLLDHKCAGIAVRAPGGTNNGDLPFAKSVQFHLFLMKLLADNIQSNYL